MDKAFAKTDRNIITCTIDENGDVIYLATDANDAFLNDGTEVTRRASHVEPDDFVLRVAFYILRSISGNKNTIAEWTRNWKCLWRVNTKPVGGPILTWADVWRVKGHLAVLPWLPSLSQYNHVALWRNRQEAIDTEIQFLNDWFLERGIR